jgi:tryptophan-rich sensory protein
MMARSTNAPCKGRIQKRKTTLHLLKSGLQRTAGPYKSATSGLSAPYLAWVAYATTISAGVVALN